MYQTVTGWAFRHAKARFSVATVVTVSVIFVLTESVLAGARQRETLAVADGQSTPACEHATVFDETLGRVRFLRESTFPSFVTGRISDLA